MKGPQNQYTKELYERFGYLATWTPGTPIAIGDIGEMDGNVFRRVSSLKLMEIPFSVRKDRGHEDLLYTSESGIMMNFKAAGTPVIAGSSLVTQKAGVTIDFQRGAGVVFVARNCLSHSIEDQISLGKEIIRRYITGGWDARYVVVSEVIQADSMTAFISESSGGKIELIAENNLNLGTVNLADFNANFSVGNSSGIHTQIIAKDKLTPLFRVRKIKASFWNGVSFENEKMLHNLEDLPQEIEVKEENLEFANFEPNFSS